MSVHSATQAVRSRQARPGGRHGSRRPAKARRAHDLPGARGVASGLGFIPLAGGVAFAAMVVLVLIRQFEP
jgi:hypothetical protein